MNMHANCKETSKGFYIEFHDWYKNGWKYTTQEPTHLWSLIYNCSSVLCQFIKSSLEISEQRMWSWVSFWIKFHIFFILLSCILNISLFIIFLMGKKLFILINLIWCTSNTYCCKNHFIFVLGLNFHWNDYAICIYILNLFLFS